MNEGEVMQNGKRTGIFGKGSDVKLQDGKSSQASEFAPKPRGIHM